MDWSGQQKLFGSIHGRALLVPTTTLADHPRPTHCYPPGVPRVSLRLICSCSHFLMFHVYTPCERQVVGGGRCQRQATCGGQSPKPAECCCYAPVARLDRLLTRKRRESCFFYFLSLCTVCHSGPISGENEERPENATRQTHRKLFLSHFLFWPP